MFLLIIIVGGALASYYGAFAAACQRPSTPVSASDFKLRFQVVSFQLSKEHLARAPKAIHTDARIGTLFLSFDLVLLETLEHGSLGGRGAPIPKITYNASNVTFKNLDQFPTFEAIAGKELRFVLPMSLRLLVGPDTKYQVEMFIGNRWFTSGDQSFEGGTVLLPLDRY